MNAIITTLIGAAVGLGWYYLVGCKTGACPLTSNLWLSAGMGALVGYSLGGPS